MRIAFIAGCLSRRASGVKVVVERLSAALEDAGQEIQVFGLEDTAWIKGDKKAWTGAPAQVFATRGIGAFGYAPDLARAVETFRPDLVHAHGLWMYGSMVSARLASRGAANVVSPHGMLDSWALAQSRFKKIIVGRLFEDRHLHEAVALHALNTEEANAIRDYGLTSPVAVLPNGVDIAGSNALLVGPKWRNQLPRDAKILLYLGRLHRKKNLVALIEAFAIAKHEPWHLVIAGPDQDGEAEALHAVINSYGLQEHVHLVGPQFGADKTASFTLAHGFILPSLSEGLPMAVLEAWAARLPVLMSEQCNLPQGFAAGAALRSGTQRDAIERSLKEFFALSDETRASIGALGYDLVVRNYSWAGIAAHFMKLYEWSCDKRWKEAPSFVQVTKSREAHD